MNFDDAIAQQRTVMLQASVMAFAGHVLGHLAASSIREYREAGLGPVPPGRIKADAELAALYAYATATAMGDMS